ncbi:MAG: tetratricopeptide repeat protein [Pseudomonadota bacterium]
MSPLRSTVVSPALLASFAFSLGLLLVACRQQPPDAALREAQALRGNGQAAAAEGRLRQLLQSDIDNRAAHRMLGELYLEQGKLVEAERELRRALLLGADAGPVTLLLGTTLLKQGQYTRVLNEISPVAPMAQRPATLALRGNAALELGDLDGARAMFVRALSYHPDAPDALLGLARIAHYQRQTGQAQQFLARALAIHPDDPAIVQFRAELAREQDSVAPAPSLAVKQ